LAAGAVAVTVIRPEGKIMAATKLPAEEQLTGGEDAFSEAA
jgi:hypothetical protein